MHGGDALVGPVKNQRRNAHRVEDRANVDFGECLQDSPSHPRARARALEAAPHGSDLLVLHGARREVLDQRGSSPVPLDGVQPGLVILERPAEAKIGGGAETGRRAVKHERPRAVGIRRREEEAHRAAL